METQVKSKKQGIILVLILLVCGIMLIELGAAAITFDKKLSELEPEIGDFQYLFAGYKYNDSGAVTYNPGQSSEILDFELFRDNATVGDSVWFAWSRGPWHNLTLNITTPVNASNFEVEWKYYYSWTNLQNLTIYEDTCGNFTTAGICNIDFDCTTLKNRQPTNNPFDTRGMTIVARITNVSGLTEGGQVQSIDGNSYAITIHEGESATPGELKTVSDAGNWSMVDKLNAYYFIKSNLILKGSFTIDDNEVVELGNTTHRRIFLMRPDSTFTIGKKVGNETYGASMFKYHGPWNWMLPYDYWYGNLNLYNSIIASDYTSLRLGAIAAEVDIINSIFDNEIGSGTTGDIFFWSTSASGSIKNFIITRAQYVYFYSSNIIFDNVIMSYLKYPQNAWKNRGDIYNVDLTFPENQRVQFTNYGGSGSDIINCYIGDEENFTAFTSHVSLTSVGNGGRAKYDFTLDIKNEVGSPINATVNLTDRYGNNYFNGNFSKNTTRVNIYYTIIEVAGTRTEYYYNPFTLKVSHPDYADYEASFNITYNNRYMTVGGQALSFVKLNSTIPAQILLNKIATVHNTTNTTINYNVTITAINKGGTDASSVNITDSDSPNSPYNLGTLSSNSSLVQSYIETFSRQDTTTYQLLSTASVEGIDEYNNTLLSADSNIINITVPDTSVGKQIVITKNVVYLSENSTTATYNVSAILYNSGDEDLSSISYSDTDLADTAFTIDIDKGESYLISNVKILSKAASNTDHQFALGTATTAGPLTFYSNRPTIQIPGYGGPADIDVYAPASVQTSTDFDSTVEVENVNTDIGQDFSIDYWISSEDNSVNYSSGRKVSYVGASSKHNESITLNSPSSVGTYKLNAIVSWVGGSDIAWDSFTVSAPDSEEGGSGSSGGGIITGGAIYEAKAEEIENGFVKQLRDKDKIKFNIIQEEIIQEHSLEIVNLKSDSVLITIYSEPVSFSLKIGEEKRIDLDNDDYYDLYVKLEKIENSNAFINLKLISEKVEELDTPEEFIEDVKMPFNQNYVSYIKTHKAYFIIGAICVILLAIIIIGILSRKKSQLAYTNKKIKSLNSQVKYLKKLEKRKKIEKKLRKNLKKLKSETALVLFSSLMLVLGLFLLGNSLTGFVVGDSETKLANWSILGVILVIGIIGTLIFLYLKKRKKTTPMDSLSSLAKKKVYTEEGEYIGKVREIILVNNKIDSLKIKFDRIVRKERKLGSKGIIISYNDVRNVRHVVIIDERVSKNL